MRPKKVHPASSLLALAVATFLAFGLALSINAFAQSPLDMTVGVAPHAAVVPLPVDPVQAVPGIVSAIQAHQWPTAVSLGLMMCVWLLRAKAPSIESHWASFFHTKIGVLLISAVPALFQIVAHAVAENGFSWPPLVMAVGMYVFTLMIASNPSLIQAQVPVADAVAISPVVGKVLK